MTESFDLCFEFRGLRVFVLFWSLALAAMGQLVPDRDRPLPEAERRLGGANCTACHPADARDMRWLGETRAPRLESVASRIHPTYLREFLTDPSGLRPGTAMPDPLHGLPTEQRSEVVEDLVHYLSTRGNPIVDAGGAVDPTTIELGRQLFHEVGCVACHGPLRSLVDLEHQVWIDDPERRLGPPTPDGPAEPYLPPGTLPAPGIPLPDLAKKTSIDALASFLEDPLAVRPSGEMPDLDLTTEQARAVATYLMSGRLLGTDELVPGLLAAYFEGDNPHDVPELSAMTLVREDVVTAIALPEPRAEDRFGYRVRGFVRVPRPGSYTFHLSSDDGARLFVDGRLLLDNRGRHPMRAASGRVDLAEGLVGLEVTYFEDSGGEGLVFEWEGPELPRGPIPPEQTFHLPWRHRAGPPVLRTDPARVARGRDEFHRRGCSACHGAEDPSRVAAPAKPWSDLSSHGGCLEESPPAAAPKFAPTSEALAELQGAFATQRARVAEPTPSVELSRRLDRLRCYACHARDGVGGPHPERKDFFRVRSDLLQRGDVDVGDPGRLPPELTHVGRKLQRTWMQAVLVEGRRALGHLGTKMPSFGPENVASLVDAFAEADPETPSDRVGLPVTEELVAAGRRLAGQRGIGCIRCHSFAGFASLGMPAADLTDVTLRVRPAFFRQMLKDPDGTAMGTRMPSFFEGGRGAIRDVFDGDPESQTDALWAYFSLGRAMPTPEGVDLGDGRFALEPSAQPCLVSVFLEGASARGLLVGHPQRVHYAYDLEHARFDRAWQGFFFDARGTWQGRAGRLEHPEGDEGLRAPAGSPIALSLGVDAPWPERSANPIRASGRAFDLQGAPSFHSRGDGLACVEAVRPVVDERGAGLRRSFEFRGARSGEVTVLAGRGKSITEQGSVFLIDAEPRHRVTVRAGSAFVVRRAGVAELRVDAAPGEIDDVQRVELEIHW